MKKSLSLFLAFVMLLSVTAGLNISAFATETIANVVLHNADTVEAAGEVDPQIGRPLCYDFSIGWHASIDTDINGRGYAGECIFYNGVSWRDLTNGGQLNADSVFTANHIYQLKIVIKPDEGYTFKTSDGMPNVGATVRVRSTNETYAPFDSVEFLDGSLNELVLTKEFTCPEATVLSTVSYSAYAPVIGGTPSAIAITESNSGVMIDTSEDANYLDNKVCWKHGDTVMTADDEFERGETYTREVRLMARHGYLFKTQGGVSQVTGSEGNVITGTPGKEAIRYITVKKTFTLVEKLSRFDITLNYMENIFEGDAPRYCPVSESPEEYNVVNINENDIFVDGVAYYDITGKKWMNKNDEFISSHWYEVYVAVRPAAGYELYIGGCYINGIRDASHPENPNASPLTGNTYGDDIVFYNVTLGKCKKNINNCTVEAKDSGFPLTATYTGSPITFKFNVTYEYNGKKQTLVKGEDYDVAYVGNIAAGKGFVTISGIGDFAGDWDFELTIKKKSSTPKITMTYKEAVYNGSARAQTVKVYDGSKQLKSGTDYTIVYTKAKPKNVGIYTATITAKGNYSFSKKTVTYKVIPKSTSLLKTASTGKDWISPQWKKQTTQTTGYEIMYSKSAGFKSGNKTATVTKNTQTVKKITGLKKNTKYYFKIRTYKTVKHNGKNVKVYSKWSGVKEFKTKKK